MPTLAEQLLDAQVAFHLEQLSGAHLEETARGLTEDLLAALAQRPVRELVDAEIVTAIVVRGLGTVLGSRAVAELVELGVDVALDAPATPYPLGDVVPRERVEELLDALLARTPELERALDRASASPLAAVVATRFLGRVLAVAMETNRSVADKVLPGLGSLMSFGSSAASRVVGAADTQLHGLLGDTVGRGGSFAAGRLGKVVVETLRDPTTREAVLQAWDQLASRPAGGLGARVDRDGLGEAVGAAHALVVDVLAHEYVAQLAAASVAAFVERFGHLSPTELLDELAIDPADVTADVVALAPGILDTLRESGDLERIIRARLAPFYASPEVAEILG